MDKLPAAILARGQRLKAGIHFLINIDAEQQISLDLKEHQWQYIHAKASSAAEGWEKLAERQENAWMLVDVNKGLDAPYKAIHSAQLFALAFKRENYLGGKKYLANQQKEKSQIFDRFGSYFEKAASFLTEAEQQEFSAEAKAFQALFAPAEDLRGGYPFVYLLETALRQRQEKYELLSADLAELEGALKTAKKEGKAALTNKVKDLKLKLQVVEPLAESDYICFYLNVEQSKFEQAHRAYLDQKLFNKNSYNRQKAAAKDEKDIYGSNNFYNGYDSKKLFLLHQTAYFKLPYRIHLKEAHALDQFQKLLMGKEAFTNRKLVPNPLPLFIYEEELQAESLALFAADGSIESYAELLKGLVKRQKNKDKSLTNFYLLFFARTKNGLFVHELDYVERFNYFLEEDGKSWIVSDLLQRDMRPIQLVNRFELQEKLLPILFDQRFFRTSFFFEAPDKIAADRAALISKYQQALYDFIYKSKAIAFQQAAFKSLCLSAIELDLKDRVEEWKLVQKLNILFSLYDKFNPNQSVKTTTMANQLQAYQEQLENMLNSEDYKEEISLEAMLFAAGQLAAYLESKSQAAGHKYQRLEAYLQQQKMSGLQAVVSDRFARYKHQNFTKKFERLAALLLTYPNEHKIKAGQPLFLAGFFAQNRLYSSAAE